MAEMKIDFGDISYENHTLNVAKAGSFLYFINVVLWGIDDALHVQKVAILSSILRVGNLQYRQILSSTAALQRKFVVKWNRYDDFLPFDRNYATMAKG